MAGKHAHFFIAAVVVMMSTPPSAAQSWTSLNNPPSAPVGLCLLLTDATVMCQSYGSWLKLTPDAFGSYVNGTWSEIASFPSGYVPDAFASAVLADGRVVAVWGRIQQRHIRAH